MREYGDDHAIEIPWERRATVSGKGIEKCNGEFYGFPSNIKKKNLLVCAFIMYIKLIKFYIVGEVGYVWIKWVTT